MNEGTNLPAAFYDVEAFIEQTAKDEDQVVVVSWLNVSHSLWKHQVLI